MRRLKSAIVAMDIYRSRNDIRLDERKLAQDFGISRTPVREAMAQLESEGFVRSVPRRGIYVVRKTKREVIEMITAWAALESMAARLMTESPATRKSPRLRKMFATFENGKVRAHLDEYSDVNIEFHQSHHPAQPQRRADRSRRKSVHPHAHDPAQDHRREGSRRPFDPRPHAASSKRSKRATPIAPKTLVRDHALGLADHVARYADYLD